MISRVLVAGGTGRLGSIVVTELAARGVEVRVMTREPERAAHLRGERIEVVTGDVRDLASTTAAPPAFTSWCRRCTASQDREASPRRRSIGTATRI